MTIDERRLNQLIVESQDLQVDALQDMRATLPDLADIREERRGEEVNTDEIDRYNAGRRQLLQRLGLGAGGFATRSLFAGGMGSFLAAMLGSPARADTPLDIQILQTASSLEVLAVNTYETAMTLPFIQSSPKAVISFATKTRQQHDEHRKAFQAQTRTLGGKEQNQPNPMFQQVVQQETPKLKATVDVVGLAKTLETVATETYLEDTSQLEDTASRKVMASVMGVETQHAAVLAAVELLLKSGSPELIEVPFPASNLAELPSVAGSVGFPNAFEPTTQAAPPESGAVK